MTVELGVLRRLRSNMPVCVYVDLYMFVYVSVLMYQVTNLIKIMGN